MVIQPRRLAAKKRSCLLSVTALRRVEHIPITSLALLARGGRRRAIEQITVIEGPVVVDRVQTMRPVGDGVGHGCMTSRALSHHARVALQGLVSQVVVGVGAGEFGVSGAVAGGALQTAVPHREAI